MIVERAQEVCAPGWRRREQVQHCSADGMLQAMVPRQLLLRTWPCMTGL